MCIEYIHMYYIYQHTKETYIYYTLGLGVVYGHMVFLTNTPVLTQ